MGINYGNAMLLFLWKGMRNHGNGLSGSVRVARIDYDLKSGQYYENAIFKYYKWLIHMDEEGYYPVLIGIDLDFLYRWSLPESTGDIYIALLCGT